MRLYCWQTHYKLVYITSFIYFNISSPYVKTVILFQLKHHCLTRMCSVSVQFAVIGSHR